MKKLSLLIVVLLATITVSLAQVKSLIGVWKPVFMEMEGLFKADVKGNKITMDEKFNAKGMEDMKKMLQGSFQIMIDEMKETTEEYKTTGKHIETKKGIKKESAYKFDAATNIVIVENEIAQTGGEKTMSFKIEFINNGYKMSGEIPNPMDETKKMKILIEYEKAFSTISQKK